MINEKKEQKKELLKQEPENEKIRAIYQDIEETKDIMADNIEKMTAKADVGRSTYFRYFKSKEEVLSFKLLCLWRRFSAERGGDGIARVDPQGIRTLFEFCLSIRPICELLYDTGHQEVILRFYLQGAAPVIAQADAKTY